MQDVCELGTQVGVHRNFSEVSSLSFHHRIRGIWELNSELHVCVASQIQLSDPGAFNPRAPTESLVELHHWEMQAAQDGASAQHAGVLSQRSSKENSQAEKRLLVGVGTTEAEREA